MRRDCLASADLVAALDDAAPAEIKRHARDCSDCREELIQLRAAASAVLASAMEMPKPWSPCLGKDSIADLAEGRPDGVDAATLDHLATCERCCHQLGSIARILGDAGVAAELRRLEESTDVCTVRSRACARCWSATGSDPPTCDRGYGLGAVDGSLTDSLEPLEGFPERDSPWDRLHLPGVKLRDPSRDLFTPAAAHRARVPGADRAELLVARSLLDRIEGSVRAAVPPR